MNLRLVFAVAVAFPIAALSIGCSKGYTKTQVKITMDGAPVAGATVTLIPNSPETAVGAAGQTDENGVCSLSAPNKPGVANGKYKVLVVKNEQIQGIDSSNPSKSMKDFFESQGGNKRPGGVGGGAPTGPKSLLPEKYAKPDTTDLTLEVPASGVVELKLVK